MDESRTARVTVEEAARLLGIEKASVKKRIQRGKLRSEKDAGGTTWVRLGLSETVQDGSTDQSGTGRDELADELRDRIRYLERQVEEEREARRRADTIIAQLTQANTALASRVPELEAPETVEEGPERAEPRSAAAGGGAQGGAQRPWWRRVFGGREGG